MLRVFQLVIVIWNFLKLVLIYGELPRRAPTPTVYWPYVYEMERDIYGHTFNHIGAPPDDIWMTTVRSGTRSPNEARLLANETVIPLKNIEMQAKSVAVHVKPLSGYLEPSRWHEDIRKATSVIELNAIDTRARKEIEIILQTAQQENRPGLTKTEDAWCEVLYDIVARCRDKSKILAAKEQARQRVMTDA